MKRSLLLVAMACLLSIKAHAQWTTSGSDIQNTNVGNVGIGTSTPSSKLDVKWRDQSECRQSDNLWWADSFECRYGPEHHDWWISG
jgi:hypothetical protein